MSTKEKIRVHVIIEGRVQGVCFRMCARDEAVRLGLAGWVKNLHDGTVELVAEGDAGRVNELAAWCRHGPSYSHVTRVSEEYGDVTGHIDGFEIRR